MGKKGNGVKVGPGDTMGLFLIEAAGRTKGRKLVIIGKIMYRGVG